MSRRGNCNFETKEAFSQTKWAFSGLNLRLWIFYFFPRDTPGLWLPFKGYITSVVGLRNSITPIVQLRFSAPFRLQHGRYEPFEIISCVASIFNIFCRGRQGITHASWAHRLGAPWALGWNSGAVGLILIFTLGCALEVLLLYALHVQSTLSVILGELKNRPSISICTQSHIVNYVLDSNITQTQIKLQLCTGFSRLVYRSCKLA